MDIVDNVPFEISAMDPDNNFAVPVELFIPVNGERTAFVFPSVDKSMVTSLEKVGSEGFRKIAIDLSDGLMASLGYSSGPVIFDNVEFEYAGCPSCSKSENVTAVTGEIPYTQVFINGKAVSVAAVNDVCEEDGRLEIYVETDEEHRNKGYGTSCVSALAELLCERGKKVLYVCSSDNAASMRVAEKCGFIKTGERLSAVYYREFDR